MLLHRKLQYLKDEALAFDSEEDMAALASDEEIRWRQSNMTEKPSDVGITDVKNDRKSPLCVTTDAGSYYSLTRVISSQVNPSPCAFYRRSSRR